MDYSSSTVSVRKRARPNTAAADSSLATPNPTASTTFNSNSNSATTTALLHEIDKLKTELTNLQSRRNLDKIQNESNVKRLKRHIVTLEQDARDAQTLADEIRSQSDLDQEVLSRKRMEAVRDAKDWEDKYWNLRSGNEEDEGGWGGGRGGGDVLAEVEELKHRLSLEQQNQKVMQEKLSAVEHENQMLQRQLNETRAAMAGKNNNVQEQAADTSMNMIQTPSKDKPIPRTSTSTSTSTNAASNALSPAPPAVLSELNRTRIKLAESERHNRQLTRKTESLQSQANEMVQCREALSVQRNKVEQLEKEMVGVRRERDVLRVLEKRWVEFRKDLVRYNLGSEVMEGTADAGAGVGAGKNANHAENASSQSASTGTDENIPPEIATLVRHYRKLEDKIHSLKTTSSTLKIQYDVSQRRLESLEKDNHSYKAQVQKWSEERNKLKDSCIKAESELKGIKMQEKVWKREAESMRSLLDTYKQMEDKMASSRNTSVQDTGKTATGAATATVGEDATSMGLQVSLTSARDQIKLLQTQYNDTKTERDTIQKQLDTLRDEHETVRAKFMKLRDALMKEREKAEEAETRAAHAETMAGKGALNDDTTRVLHYQNNPLSNAIRAKYEKEIGELKAELAELTAIQKGVKVAVAPTTSDPALDAEKFSKRLKDQFRNQIALYREGVHIITGYKIEMNVTERPDTYRFIVRSMFAEREGDQLNLLWRKDKHGKWRSTMDILDTEWAQVLSNESSFEYMKRFNSLPAFVASVCLNLFEKQTIMG